MKVLIALIVLAFGAFDVYVSMHDGYWSVFPPFESLSKTQMFIDLAIALILFDVWMVQDWRRQGRPMLHLLPFLIAPLFLGSLGPLLYLLFRKPTQSE